MLIKVLGYRAEQIKQLIQSRATYLWQIQMFYVGPLNFIMKQPVMWLHFVGMNVSILSLLFGFMELDTAPDYPVTYKQ